MRQTVLGLLAVFGLLGCTDAGPVDARPDVAPPDVARPDDAPPDVARPVDVRPDVTRSCMVGAECGNDCYPSDAPCWACGTLHYDADCNCRANASACAPATGCDNPAPAGVGEFCGTYAWCNRPCAAGLTCSGLVNPDAGPGGQLDYRRLCEMPVDAGVVPSFPVPSPLAPARACGSLTCAAGQVCVLGCSGVDAGSVDLHRCVDVPDACRSTGTCPCASICGQPSCQPVGDVVRCTGCA